MATTNYYRTPPVFDLKLKLQDKSRRYISSFDQGVDPLDQSAELGRSEVPLV